MLVYHGLRLNYLYYKIYNMKKVIQKEKTTGKIVNIYHSIKSAEIATGIRTIHKCLRGKQDTAGGFLWLYHEGNAKNISASSRRRRPVVKIDQQNGNQIAWYLSVQKAARENGISASNISKVITGKKKTAGGFLWGTTYATPTPWVYPSSLAWTHTPCVVG